MEIEYMGIFTTHHLWFARVQVCVLAKDRRSLPELFARDW